MYCSGEETKWIRQKEQKTVIEGPESPIERWPVKVNKKDGEAGKECAKDYEWKARQRAGERKGRDGDHA